MRNVKKLINKYYDDTYNHDIDLNDLKEKANINKKNNKGGIILFMKTKKLAIISTAVFFLAITAIVIGCSLNNNQKNDPVVKDAVITLDLNPSIEITIDENGNVSSVYGNNDEGKMIIIDIKDEIIGKEYKKALDVIIEAETECGFFVKATSNEDYNNLTITIDSGAVEHDMIAMRDYVKAHIESKLIALNVEVENKINVVKNNSKDALINKLLELDPSLTKDELNDKSHKELINLISAYHIERINFPTDAIEEMYNNFKEYELNIAETRIFKSFVSSSSSLNDVIINNYDNLYNLTQQALASLKLTYEEVFISEESAYVKAYNKLLETKKKVLDLRTEVENLEDGIEKTLKQTQLSAAETALLTAESALGLAKEAANASLSLVSTTLNQALSSIKEYIMETSDLQTIMTENANELSTKLNAEKAEFINLFENEYKGLIEAEYAKLVAQKAALIEQLKN